MFKKVKIYKQYFLTKVVVGLVLVACIAVPCQAITTSDWVDKCQGWIDARDNGSFTTDIDVYDVNGETETSQGSGDIWFQDDANDGWSYRKDLTLDFGECGTEVYKNVDAPDGQQAFFGSTCIYPWDNALVSGWSNQSHTSLPKIFYVGDNDQNSLSALNEISTSTSASTTTLDSVSVYKLEVTFDVNALNQDIDDPNNQLDPNNDSVSGIFYVRSDNGAPVQEDFTITADSETVGSRRKWSNINTSPTIPGDTFDLTQDTPSMTFEEAVADWMEANCP